LAKEGLVNNAQQMDEFCKEKGFAKWFETSAKENINIDTSTRFLISEVIIEISLSFSFLTFSLKIMKHTEQLQPRALGERRVGALVVHDKPMEKGSGGRKCCGGGNDSDDRKN
jgi:hypothetical protein